VELIENKLYTDIVKLIDKTKHELSYSINSALTILYWNIGKFINDEILNTNRAKYGEQIVKSVSIKLMKQYGRGYSKRNLLNMIKFNKIYNDIEIVQSLIAQLSWTHIQIIISIDDPLKREFYVEMIKLDRWSTRVLKERIDSQLFERTAISKNSNEVIKYELEQLKDGNITSNIVLKDPYILDFLELNDRYLEKDLEDAILSEMENFILELGSGFSFISRQKRIQIDDEDYIIDLLFYNRKLKRLVVVELKLGKFKASYKGQMELYLRWLDKYEKEEDEKSPLGIILCADKKSEQIELLELEKSNIHVAQYLTVLPQKELLHKKLQEAIENAKKRLEL